MNNENVRMYLKLMENVNFSDSSNCQDSANLETEIARDQGTSQTYWESPSSVPNLLGQSLYQDLFVGGQLSKSRGTFSGSPWNE